MFKVLFYVAWFGAAYFIQKEIQRRTEWRRFASGIASLVLGYLIILIAGVIFALIGVTLS